MKTAFTAFGYALALSVILCLYLVHRQHLALRSAQQCEGTVTSYSSQRGSKGSTTYALKIAYADQNGAAHHFTTSSASNPPERPIGAKVVVFHYPDGSTPKVLVFADLYLLYWLWFCVCIFTTGCLLASKILSAIYVR